MTKISTRSRVLLAVGCVLIAAALAIYWQRSSGRDEAKVLDDVAGVGGWQTIEFHNAVVDIPGDWSRQDRDDCEFDFEHWVPPDSPSCDTSIGVSFYTSATFDPATGPGLHRGNTETDPAAWAGYVDAGEYVVYAAGPERDTVKLILESVAQVD